jgi:aspartate/methionine/tyrosine aminotransferase
MKVYANSLIQKNTGGRPIFLIADEPYREIAYDGKTVSPILSKYKKCNCHKLLF